MPGSFGIDFVNGGDPTNGMARVDARAKMLISLVASVATVAFSDMNAQLVLLAASVAYALGMRKPKILLIAYIFVLAMCVVAMGLAFGMSLLVPAMKFPLESLAVPFLRVLTMVNVILPLALTSRLQALLTALKGLHLPFCIYIPAAVMLRFIPTFINDIKQVRETLKIRGYHMTIGETFRHPIMMLRLMFTPLLFRSLRTSEELGIAAELKGLDAYGTLCPYRQPRWRGMDTALLVGSLLVVAVAAVIQYRTGTPFFSGVHS